MPKIVRTEYYQRGIFGWLFRIVFWAFNLLMLAWIASYWGILSGGHFDGAHSEAAKAEW
jgi:hypothetical protein